MRRVKLYHAADSWLHRLHPSAKLLLWVFLAFLLACLPWALKAPIFLALVVALWSTRVPFGHYRLIVFLALYFLFLWVSWMLAVRLTKPKVAELPAA